MQQQAEQQEEEQLPTRPPKKPKTRTLTAPNTPPALVVVPLAPCAQFAQDFLTNHYTGQPHASPYATLCAWSRAKRARRDPSLMNLLFQDFLHAAQNQNGLLEHLLDLLCSRDAGIQNLLNKLIHAEFLRQPPRDQRFRDTLVINVEGDWLNCLALNTINKMIGKEKKAEHQGQLQVAGCTHTIVQIQEGTTRIHLVCRRNYDPSYGCIVSVMNQLAHHLGGAQGIASRMLELVHHPAHFLPNHFPPKPNPRISALLYSQHGNSGVETFTANSFLSCLVGLLLVVEPFYATVLYGSSLDMLELIEDGLMDFDDVFGHRTAWQGGLFPLYNTGQHEGSARVLSDVGIQGIHSTVRDRLLALLRQGFGPESCALYKALFIQLMHTLAQEGRAPRALVPASSPSLTMGSPGSSGERKRGHPSGGDTQLRQ
ncbi:hypothetical protein KRR26_23095 [Corallococcus sp. M34]|uniref:hypothetical protein n=1 Tax=Citreicoccus inhibens TaxID=2849499 RepID=UPI001C246CC9|nr:hypothetical protein [Citreicoccus inhibens]MBU8898501.1 hypothetical protein [Citreicoccus inhibens]